MVPVNVSSPTITFDIFLPPMVVPVLPIAAASTANMGTTRSEVLLWALVVITNNIGRPSK
jgi:hypothetical protein